MMLRRNFLKSVSLAALTAAWSRVVGATVGVRQRGLAVPVPEQHLTAGDHMDHMWRDVYRRKIDADEFMQIIFKRTTGVFGKLNRNEIDEAAAARMISDLHDEALRHPPPPREIPPLPTDQVGVDEVMELLRRTISGDATIVVEQKWCDVWHTDGNFVIDGWRLSGFKRSYGIKYISEAIAPDGRRGTYDSWSDREGNPVHLLDNDEQDAFDEMMEALVPPEPGDEIRRC